MTRRPLQLLILTALLALMGPACKVGLSDLGAGFIVADTAWFALEETLFVFYEVEATQGLGDETVLEIRYTTDDGEQPWVALSELTQIHTHVKVDCGPNTRCGSGSLHVPKEPRDVRLRLRYHRDGELALEQDTVFNVVGPGPAWSHRSLLIYGVFDETNRAIQWRARHRFPTVRNEDASRLGLRRDFTIEAQAFAEAMPDLEGDNPYAYGLGCQDTTALGFAAVKTDERAVFNPEDLPDGASRAAVVCAEATVKDAKGPFTTGAIAAKNPEVRPAFPVLRSPVREARPIQYMLTFCDRTISTAHEAMQAQRLLLDDDETRELCLDAWQDGGLKAELLTRFQEDVGRVRAEGRDMVLSIALHHDERAIAGLLEGALGELMATERMRATPRLVGAFVLDSYLHTVTDEGARGTVLWCPAEFPTAEEGEETDVSSLASLGCAIRPDTPTSVGLGPFDLGFLPILPSRAMYLDFIATYSEDQAGRMTALSFRAPELPPSASHVAVEPFGMATFFNDEVISADRDDAFSYCASDEYPGFVFRSALMTELGDAELGEGTLPISGLPDWHWAWPEESYELGLVWDFPFLVRLEYEATAAAAASLLSASIPFGLDFESSTDYGSQLWLEEAIPLGEALLQCRRFCRHPTFDAAGIYQIAAPFDPDYLTACYDPAFPRRGDSGFPDDP